MPPLASAAAAELFFLRMCRWFSLPPEALTQYILVHQHALTLTPKLIEIP